LFAIAEVKRRDYSFRIASEAIAVTECPVLMGMIEIQDLKKKALQCVLPSPTNQTINEELVIIQVNEILLEELRTKTRFYVANLGQKRQVCKMEE